MEGKLTRADLKAIRGIVRSEVRRSDISKLCCILKFTTVVLAAAAMIYGIVMIAEKFASDEEKTEEAEE